MVEGVRPLPLGAALELGALGLGLTFTVTRLAALPSWRIDLGTFQALCAVAFGFYALALLRLRRFTRLPRVGLWVFAVALACRASRQVTSRSRARSSCTSHGVIGPVSIPSLASSPACPLKTRAICSGSVAHWPRQSRVPVSSTMQIEVSFCETSNPTNRAIEPPPMYEPPGDTRPDRSTFRADPVTLVGT